MRAHVDEAVEQAKAMPEPPMSDYWQDIYVKGTEPPTMRGLDRLDIKTFP